MRDPSYDFDGDGFSNLVEFAMGSDPADVASVPGAGVIAPAPVVTPGVFEVTPLAPGVVSVAGGECRVSITKRPDVGSSLTYYIEHSEDMATWTRIPTGGNVDWTEDVNDSTMLQVTSTTAIVPALAPGCYFRVAVVMNK